jgi:hypothetical protein
LGIETPKNCRALIPPLKILDFNRFYSRIVVGHSFFCLAGLAMIIQPVFRRFGRWEECTASHGVASIQAMGLPVLHVYYEDLAGSAANLEDMALPWSAVLRFHQGFDPSG